MNKNLSEENCPKCDKPLKTPLKSGRQVCSNCGWAGRQKEVITSEESKIKSPSKIKAQAYELLQKISTYSEILKSKKRITYGLLVLAGVVIAGWGTLAFVDKLRADNCRIGTKEAIGKFLKSGMM
jgi:uncharacterized Zn finger protein (UPF0148 family)